MLFPPAVSCGFYGSLSWLFDLLLGFQALLGQNLGLLFLLEAGGIGYEMGGGSPGGEFGRTWMQRKAGMGHSGFPRFGRRVSRVLSYQILFFCFEHNSNSADCLLSTRQNLTKTPLQLPAECSSLVQMQIKKSYPYTKILLATEIDDANQYKIEYNMVKTTFFILSWLLYRLAEPYWLENCQLDDSYKHLISTSLYPFRHGIAPQLIESAKLLVGDSVCLAQLKDHRLVDNNCLDQQHQCYLSSIAQYLPDMQILINKDDRPAIFKHHCPGDIKANSWVQCACDKNFTRPPHGAFEMGLQSPPLKPPVFSSCTKSQCFLDIIFPSIFHLNASQRLKWPLSWEKKHFKAFWRGSSTGALCSSSPEICHSFHRQRLVALCSKVEDCDAQFSQFLQCSRDLCSDLNMTFGLAQKFVPLQAQARYKVLIDIDGNSYSGRFPNLLSTGSVVLKIHLFQDIATEVMKPWEHYIPGKLDLSDFEEKLAWIRENDDRARRIAERGQQRAGSILSYKALQCYGIHLLKAYHKLLIKPKTFS